MDPPGHKAERQSLIQRLIGSRAIHTQDELAAELRRAGWSVTQATVSRDIRELGLVKVPAGDGRYRYAPSADGASAPGPDERLVRLMLECLVSFDHSENLVVITTLPGTAMSVAEAVDAMRAPEVVGTLAGERTVFVVVKPREAVPTFCDRLRAAMGAPSTDGAAGPGTRPRGRRR